jgi:hypothetical protein
MTTDQQAAYWKHQAKKHEGRNSALLGVLKGHTMPGLKTTTYGTGDYSWMLNTDGLDEAVSGVLTSAPSPPGTHFPNGYFPSGPPRPHRRPRRHPPLGRRLRRTPRLPQGRRQDRRRRGRQLRRRRPRQHQDREAPARASPSPPLRSSRSSRLELMTMALGLTSSTPSRRRASRVTSSTSSSSAAAARSPGSCRTSSSTPTTSSSTRAPPASWTRPATARSTPPRDRQGSGRRSRRRSTCPRSPATSRSTR